MTPRRVPWVPPRPLFAIAVAFRNLLARFLRTLASHGGYGTVVGHVLAQNQHLEGVLFDDPAVLDEARPVLDAWGVTDRVRVRPSDVPR